MILLKFLHICSFYRFADLRDLLLLQIRCFYRFTVFTDLLFVQIVIIPVVGLTSSFLIFLLLTFYIIFDEFVRFNDFFYIVVNHVIFGLHLHPGNVRFWNWSIFRSNFENLNTLPQLFKRQSIQNFNMIYVTHKLIEESRILDW